MDCHFFGRYGSELGALRPSASRGVLHPAIHDFGVDLKLCGPPSRGFRIDTNGRTDWQLFQNRLVYGTHSRRIDTHGGKRHDLISPFLCTTQGEKHSLGKWQLAELVIRLEMQAFEELLSQVACHAARTDVVTQLLLSETVLVGIETRGK